MLLNISKIFLLIIFLFLSFLTLFGCSSKINLLKVNIINDEAYQASLLNRGLSIADFNFTNINNDFEIVATSFERDKIIDRKVIHEKKDLNEINNLMISINDLQADNNIVNINSLTKEGAYYNKKLKYNMKNLPIDYVKHTSLEKDVNIDQHKEVRLLLLVSSDDDKENGEMDINKINMNDYSNGVIVSLNKK